MVVGAITGEKRDGFEGDVEMFSYVDAVVEMCVLASFK